VAAVLKKACPCVLDGGLLESLVTGALKCQLADDRTFVRLAGLKGARHLMSHQLTFSLPSSFSGLAAGITRLVADESSEVRAAALSVVKKIAKYDPSLTSPHLQTLGPAVIEALNDKNGTVKVQAERAVRFLLSLGTDFEACGAFLKTPEGNKMRPRLTDMMQKRLSRLPEDSGGSDQSDDEK